MTHRAGELLAACLASLRAQTRGADEVLVVVSNTRVEVDAPALQLGENVGYARAANAGAAATTGELLLLNDDTRLHPGCLAALEAAWRGPGVYQPRIVLPGGTLDNVGHGFFPDGFVWARGRDGPDAPLPGEPGGFSGAAVLVARGVWRALGGFDERFDSFGEDVDLSLRLMRRGIPVTAVHDARVEHLLGATYGRTGPDKVRRIERNRVRAAIRSLPATALVTMPLWTAARYALLAGLAADGRGPGRGVPERSRRAALEGIAEGLRDVPTWWRARAEDRPHWTRGELAMWRAMLAGRARWEDLCR
ncbi:MAG: glycosyltransferase family 2 protein [Myxococcota bacterium]